MLPTQLQGADYDYAVYMRCYVI